MSNEGIEDPYFNDHSLISFPNGELIDHHGLRLAVRVPQQESSRLLPLCSWDRWETSGDKIGSLGHWGLDTSSSRLVPLVGWFGCLDGSGKSERMDDHWGSAEDPWPISGCPKLTHANAAKVHHHKAKTRPGQVNPGTSKP